MKKTLLLSVVASTMIMAGGDIAPVEPVVETPVVAEASGWDFGGQAVAYYQTTDRWGDGDFFSGDSTANDIGLQLRASNKDLFAGIGAGLELSGLYSNHNFSNLWMQSGDGSRNGAALTQAYLTYGFGNTSIKIGRQQLPKALSPFAFSEGWNVFKNTFEAALVVNSDIPDTTLVYAFVTGSNHHNDLGEFNDINHDGVHMITAQNKSVENLTLTGTWYYAPDMTGDDVHVLWADAKYNAGSFNVALQGGTVLVDTAGLDDTTAFGAKVGGNFGIVDASVAYSTVDDGSVPIHNLGTGVKTPLYTQMIANQTMIKKDNDTVVARVGVKALGGKFGVAYGYTQTGSASLWAAYGDYQEVDVTYKTKVGDSTTLFAGYIYQNDEDPIAANDTQNIFRVWGRYNF